MQSKKAIVIVLVALMITGGMGYFLQTEHHTVEKLTYDYQGDTGPSVQYSQIDEWTEYNPLDNVTGWNREGGRVTVPTLTSGASNQFLLKRASYDYLEHPVSVGAYSYLGASASTQSGPTPLSPYWMAVGSASTYGVSSQGIGNNYPENRGPGDFHEVFGVGLFEEEIGDNGSHWNLTRTVSGEEALRYVSGGYSQVVKDLEYSVGIPSNHYVATNYLNISLNVDNGLEYAESTESSPVFFVSLDTYHMIGLKTGDVIDLANLPNFGVISSREVKFYWHLDDVSILFNWFGQVTQDITLNINTLHPPSSKFIYNSDTKLWFPAEWNELSNVYQAIKGEPGYYGSELGFYYVGMPSGGIQAYCNQHTPLYYSAVQSPVQYADPTQYVIVKEGGIGEWSNKETNGIIHLLASTDTIVSINDNKSNLSIPVIPYDYAYLTLDFINKEFYCQGVIYPLDVKGNPLVTTVDYKVGDYRYPLTVSGEPLPDSVTGLGFFGQEKTVYQYISVNLTPNIWYNTELTGRNIPGMSIMYDNIINPLVFDKETSTDKIYNIVNANGTIGSITINKSTNIALVSYYEESYHAGTFRLTLDHVRYMDSLTVGGEPYQLALESDEFVSPTNYSQSYGIYKEGARVGYISTSVNSKDTISISFKFDDDLGGSGLAAPLASITYTLTTSHGTAILIPRDEYRGEISILPDQYERVAVNLTLHTMESLMMGTNLPPFTIWYDDTLYLVTDGTIADSGNEFWYQVKIDGTVVGSLKIGTATGQAILTLLSTSGHEGVHTLTLNIPESEHYMAFNYTNGTWTTSKGVALGQYGLIFDDTRYHCQPVHEPDTDDYYYNVMPEGSTTVVGILHPYYYGIVLEMTTVVGYGQRTITYEIPIEWVEYPASSIVAVNPTNSDWYCPDIDMTLAPHTAIFHGNEYQLSTTPSVSTITATITYPITYKGGGPVVGSYSEKYWSGGVGISVSSTFSVVGSIEKTVSPTAQSSQIYVDYINPSYYSGTYGGRTLMPYTAVIEGIPLDFITGRTFDCEPIQEEEQNTGWYSISYRGVEIGRYRPFAEWGGPTYLGEIIIYGPESYNETHYITTTTSNPIPATAGPSPMLVISKDLYGYTMVTDIPYTAVGQIGEAPKINYTIVNLGSTTLTTPMGIQVPGNTVYDAGTSYKLSFVSKEGNVERHNLTLGDSPEIKGYLYVDDVTFEGYLQIIGQERWDFTLEEGLFSAYRSYETGRVAQSYGYYGEEILAQGVGCEVFIVDTTVAVDPLGILWGDPDMYLGYYFEEQMTHDTRLLFNAFVKTGHTMTLNGQTFNITKDGYIEVPLGKEGDMIEQHMNGMALDFIDNHVYLVFTQDKDKTLDLGTLDNRPIMVPGTSKVMQQGFLVAAMGNWYWESGLYNVTSVEAEEYGFLINGSFGLDMSSAALLMIGIIIICTAAMMYINREDEFSFVDWIIIALAIILLLVLAIIG